MLLLVLALLPFHHLSTAFSENLYVDGKHGSDSNSGLTPQTALQTLNHITSILHPGDVVHVAAYTYVLKNPIIINIPNTTWVATDTGNVFISGGAVLKSPSTTISPFAKLSLLQLNVSTLNLSSATRHLFVNNRRALRARLSSASQTKLFAGSAIAPYGYTLAPQQTQSKSASLLRPGAEFVYPQSTSPWTEPRCAVVRANASDIFMAQPCWTNLIHKACGQNAKGPPQYVEGVGPEQIEIGEWSLSDDAQLLFYSPLPTENVSIDNVLSNNISFVVPILETLLEIKSGGDGTTFEGFVFEHATWLRPGLADGFVEQQTGQCTVGTSPNNNDCNKDYWWSVKTPGNVQVSNSSHVTFSKCGFVRLGASALDFTFSSNAIIDSCYVKDVSGSGIQVGQFQSPTLSHLDQGTTISNSIIVQAGSEYSGAAGINVGYTQNITIVRNDVSDLDYTPITVGWGWQRHSCWNCTDAGNNTIGWNIVHHYKKTLNDGGGIYMLGPQNNSLIVENWVHHQGTASTGALYPDQGSAYSTWERNVVNNIGSSEWLHLWQASIHNVSVTGNFADTAVMENHGTNCPMVNNTVYHSGNPPEEAKLIMENAGVNKTNPWYDCINCNNTCISLCSE